MVASGTASEGLGRLSVRLLLRPLHQLGKVDLTEPPSQEAKRATKRKEKDTDD
jgi:hypothetical protein